MVHLTRASKQLFERPEDERFENLEALYQHCSAIREQSSELWQAPAEILPRGDGELCLQLGENGEYWLNDWSFSQACSLAGVRKETVNRLSLLTASRVLQETMPGGHRPLQLLTHNNRIRALHGASYTRLFDAD